MTVEISDSLAAISVSRAAPRRSTARAMSTAVSVRNTSANSARAGTTRLEDSNLWQAADTRCAHRLDGVAVAIGVEAGAKPADMTFDTLVWGRVESQTFRAASCGHARSACAPGTPAAGTPGQQLDRLPAALTVRYRSISMDPANKRTRAPARSSPGPASNSRRRRLISSRRHRLPGPDPIVDAAHRRQIDDRCFAQADRLDQLQAVHPGACVDDDGSKS